MNAKAYFSLMYFKEAGVRFCSTHGDPHWWQLFNLVDTLSGICHLFSCHRRWRDPGKLCLGSSLLLTAHTTVLATWLHLTMQMLGSIEKHMDYLVSTTVFATYGLSHLIPRGLTLQVIGILFFYWIPTTKKFLVIPQSLLEVICHFH